MIHTGNKMIDGDTGSHPFSPSYRGRGNFHPDDAASCHRCENSEHADDMERHRVFREPEYPGQQNFYYVHFCSHCSPEFNLCDCGNVKAKAEEFCTVCQTEIEKEDAA